MWQSWASLRGNTLGRSEGAQRFGPNRCAERREEIESNDGQGRICSVACKIIKSRARTKLRDKEDVRRGLVGEKNLTETAVGGWKLPGFALSAGRRVELLTGIGGNWMSCGCARE
jgi:hypothetical protein